MYFIPFKHSSASELLEALSLGGQELDRSVIGSWLAHWLVCELGHAP